MVTDIFKHELLPQQKPGIQHQMLGGTKNSTNNNATESIYKKLVKTYSKGLKELSCYAWE